MITILLSGGLGNQMFQYAAAKALATRLNTSVVADLLYYSKKTVTTPRQFGLGIFMLDLDLKESLKDKLFIKSLSFFNKDCPFYKRLGFYSDLRAARYDFDFESLQDGTTLFGYFQNEKYFQSIESVIRTDFQFKNQLDNINMEALKRITSVNSVAVHIRRGDYITDPAITLALCGKEYYEKAIEYVSSKVENPYFFVFSEDMEWVKDNLDFQDCPFEFIDWNHGNDSYKDMQLMSSCKHNIIANSSFSWWGAWLNANQEKIVVAPKQWFRRDFDYKQFVGYVPEDWIKL